MRVSVTLHRAEPDMDGNQRDGEARYCGFNRAYADLVIQPGSGHGVAQIDVVFPTVQADPEALGWFSIGVCEGPADMGGSIINAGPLDQPILAEVGTEPRLVATVGVFAERLAAMLADGRLFTTD